MKLRFNLGAVVEVTTLNSEKNIIVGKVQKVLEDELQLVPQVVVCGKENCTGDVPDMIVHINRQCISSWRYVKKEECDNEKTQAFTNIQQLNYYDNETGFCTGTGEYCGRIEESTTEFRKIKE